MEGFVFQFPDFDDPRLNDSQVNFEDANAFYAEFCERFPGTWSAVSWEYASTLELWRMAVQRARTFEPFSVLAMMKFGGVGHHAFGEARWWGDELFGIDNALVGYWPVVMIQNGRARIQEFSSIPDWWNKNKALLIRHMRSMNLMWDQREPGPFTPQFADLNLTKMI
jgi:branched-chain amino acid transport system substrate-binding protein